MEESEKRRQRLRAMQREAQQKQQHENPAAASPPPALLAPPKLDEAAPGMATTAPSFDFYTDPLAAFSGARRKFPASPSSFRPSYSHSPAEVAEMRPPWSEFHPHQQYSHHQIPPSPSNNLGFQQQQQSSPASSNSSGASVLRTPWPGFSSHHHLSPSGFPGAHAGRPMWQPNFFSLTPPSGTSRKSPVSAMLNSPVGGPSFQTPRSLSPRPFDHRPSGSPSNNNRGLGLGFPEKSHAGSSGGRGGPFFDYSKSPGRRGGPWLDSGRSSEQGFPRSGSGRGHRFSGSRPVSAKEHPELFYKKSMLEDPWRNLSPKPYPVRDNQSWLRTSIDSKKPKTSEFKAQASGLSLAESLESAFAAAVDDSDENLVPYAVTTD